MASMRDIKQRIKSIQSTQQITKAMKLVSTAKLQKAKGKVESTRPFFEKMQQTIASIIQNSQGLTHPYLEERQVKKSGYIVITSDRGLAGGYNSNVCKEALKGMEAKKELSLFTVGKKGRDFFARRGYNIDAEFITISENPTYYDAAKIGKLVLDLYTRGVIDEVYLVYTAFKSTISHDPTLYKLLPVDTEKFQNVDIGEEGAIMSYEPSPEAVLDDVIPKYINSIIYGALVEAAASEQGARMTAMDSATDNANDMIGNLTLQYNRARQASITQEISEIVGGAEALK